ncbi:hypothetical protein LTS08_000795 [Lithohypha guttulata]|uniref:uncharacterized protein n=1 Tax=Lithohypha guttulata TaxID=1690604 RepID=UPI002DDF116D|nr:hypothetical protein LTR51_006594 [Lithohypha guttulata]KAK5106674.1 hypothetical protein LTS08_000795 [Lithohypha guttulata]
MASLEQAKPVHLILDFDGTLTKKDTMHIVAEAGYSRQRKLHRMPPPQPWNEIVEAYMADFQKHSDSYTPKVSERTSIAQEVAWLNSLELIEKASIARALQAGIFEDVRCSDISKVVQAALKEDRVQLRNGWRELCSSVWHRNRQCRSTGGSLSVLSVNWSTSFIQQVLDVSMQATSPEQGAHDSTWLSNLRIYANELPSIVQETTDTRSEKIEHQEIRTSGDKVKVLRDIASRSKDHQGLSNALVLYVGDSSTDLECLLAADIGICIRDQPIGSGQKDLANVCSRLGIDVQSLDAQVALRSKDKEYPVLFCARDFPEIKDWFLAQNLIAFDSDTNSTETTG